MCKIRWFQWRIQDFPGGTNSPGEEASTYDFAKFSRKLHEIERIWVPRGVTCPSRPLNRHCIPQQIHWIWLKHVLPMTMYNLSLPKLMYYSTADCLQLCNRNCGREKYLFSKAVNNMACYKLGISLRSMLSDVWQFLIYQWWCSRLLSEAGLSVGTSLAFAPECSLTYANCTK